MDKDETKEIMLPPQWSIIVDGLGYEVMSLGGLPEVDSEGRKIIKFLIKVGDDRVRKRYNLRHGEELDSNGNMILKVDELDLIPLNVYDDANKKWLYTKSFKHEPTILSERDKNLKLKIDELKKRVIILEAHNLRLHEKLRQAKTNPIQFISEELESFERIGEIIAKVSNKEKKND